MLARAWAEAIPWPPPPRRTARPGRGQNPDDRYRAAASKMRGQQTSFHHITGKSLALTTWSSPPAAPTATSAPSPTGGQGAARSRLSQALGRRLAADWVPGGGGDVSSISSAPKCASSTTRDVGRRLRRRRIAISAGDEDPHRRGRSHERARARARRRYLIVPSPGKTLADRLRGSNSRVPRLSSPAPQADEPLARCITRGHRGAGRRQDLGPEVFANQLTAGATTAKPP